MYLREAHQYGGANMSQLQENRRGGGIDTRGYDREELTPLQENRRGGGSDSRGYDREDLTPLQENHRMGGDLMNQSQEDVQYSSTTCATLTVGHLGDVLRHVIENGLFVANEDGPLLSEVYQFYEYNHLVHGESDKKPAKLQTLKEKFIKKKGKYPPFARTLVISKTRVAMSGGGKGRPNTITRIKFK